MSCSLMAEGAWSAINFARP
uniref:Uncharacterized protein n=1 Tax=Anguilla anguilla TaxID=7936 RepID=A0A0E9R313_ANGAN